MTDRSSTTRALWRGLRDGSPFVVVVLPFSVLFGVVARDAGLDLLQVFAMSAVVIAGAAQFTALSLMTDGAPVFVALIAGLAVNLRMAMYSAALVPHLGQAPLWQRLLMAYAMVDQVYAVSVRAYEREPAMPLPEKVAYYTGNILAICPLWYVGTIVGALVGRAIPSSLSPDFAVPVCFLALLAPMLRGLPNIVAAGTSLTGAIAFSGVPWNLGLIMAALCAMMAGARTQRVLDRRRAEAPGRS
ncbi:MAG: AzlC family ABC transporter permease [Paracoccaceae bacterium]|nr:MAG: AzlC family ABC transporter permease [Paracoccaceae bacterium]